jgi:hypothetical protein
MTGDPYGKDVNIYGTEDNEARRQLDAKLAEKLAPTPSPPPLFPSTPVDYPSQLSSSGTSSASGGGGVLFGLMKLAFIGLIGLAVIDYFQSESDHAPRPAKPATPEQTGAVSSPAPAPALPVQAGQSVPTTRPSPPRLSPGPQVSALTFDVSLLAKTTLVLAEAGDVLVLQGNLQTPEYNIYQEVFNVADLDLSQSTYTADNHTLNVPCGSNAACFTYKIFTGSTQQDPGSLQEKNTYSLVHLWAASQQDAQRIVQDLQQLQRLQR